MSAAKCQLNEAELKLLKEKQARGVTVVGIDLAARVNNYPKLGQNRSFSGYNLKDRHGDKHI